MTKVTPVETKINSPIDVSPINVEKTPYVPRKKLKMEEVPPLVYN